MFVLAGNRVVSLDVGCSLQRNSFHQNCMSILNRNSKHLTLKRLGFLRGVSFSFLGWGVSI